MPSPVLRSSLFLLLAFTAHMAVGQNNVEKLKRKQNELRKKIEHTKSLLGETEASSVTELNQLKIIDRQVGYRQKLISNLTLQLKNTEFQIRDHRKKIKTLEIQVEQIRQRYNDMLRKAYRTQHEYSSLAYVFSAKSFHGAYSRVRYMEQMNEYRRKQKLLLDRTREELEAEIKSLEEKIDSKKVLLGEREKEKEDFVSSKQQRRQALQQLETRKQELMQNLQKQQDDDKKLAAEIKEELEKMAREEEAKNNTRTEAEKKEIKLNSAGFSSNKGKLPWPVTTHEITRKFGKAQEGPYGFQTNNTGVDISTSLGAQVNAVYEGKVVLITASSRGQVVMVSHGSYRTIYANLSQVYVKQGETLKTGQAIGSLLPKGAKISELHFEVVLLSGGKATHQNPAYWLRK